MELSRAMLWRGQLRACAEQLLSVARLFPDDPGLIHQLEKRLFFIGEINTARRCLDRLEGKVSRARPDAVIGQARILLMVRDPMGVCCSNHQDDVRMLAQQQLQIQLWGAVTVPLPWAVQPAS
jgi:hypothetical protein